MINNSISQQIIPRIMIAGTGSGCGKTTVTCGILKALCNRNMKIASFKCGPDYIDPMFHSRVIGTKARNLDIYMCGENGVKMLLAKTALGCDFSIVEGVMGLYDGQGFNADYASSNHLSLLTNTPCILVVNVKGMSLSSAALIHGFLSFKENNVKGIILNNCNKLSYLRYKEMLETTLKVNVYGFLPPMPEASIESRHLGLVTANEIVNIDKKLSSLSDACESFINIDSLISLGCSSDTLKYDDTWNYDYNLPLKYKVRIAVAHDEAFCFLYEDNLNILSLSGAEIIYFSPIHDASIPDEIDGLIFYGGYPEEYARALSENSSMLSSVKSAIDNKIPTIAECGGFMYLLQNLKTIDDNVYPMVGAIEGMSVMTNRLSRFGYLKLTAKKDNLLCKKGDQLLAHEFHYSDSENNGNDFVAVKNEKEWECIHASETLFAGYPHFHFGGNISPLIRFMSHISNKKKNGG